MRFWGRVVVRQVGEAARCPPPQLSARLEPRLPVSEQPLLMVTRETRAEFWAPGCALDVTGVRGMNQQTVCASLCKHAI